MKFKGMDHVAIAVNNLEEALKLWRALGYDVHFETVAEQGVKIGMINLDGVRIELLEPINENSPIKKFLEKRGEGLHHLALKVENILEALRELESLGFRLIDSVPKSGAGGKKIAFVHPKDTKFLLELVEG